MEFVEQAYKMALSKRSNFFVALVVSCVLMISFAVMEQLGEWDVKVIIVTIGMILLFIITIKAFFLSSRHVRRGIEKMFKETGDASQFFQTIDTEMQDREVIKFFDKRYRLTLLVTQTWFVFISGNGSTIRKVSEITSVSKKLLTSSSEYALIVEFSNGSKFSNRCNAVCDEVIKLLKRGL